MNSEGVSCAFKGISGHENGGLRLQNAYLRDDTP